LIHSRLDITKSASFKESAELVLVTATQAMCAFLAADTPATASSITIHFSGLTLTFSAAFKKTLLFTSKLPVKTAEISSLPQLASVMLIC
jgi:hypothetical protein